MIIVQHYVINQCTLQIQLKKIQLNIVVKLKNKMPTDTTGPTSVNVRRISFALGSISMIMVVFLVAAPYWRVTARWGTAAVIANIYSFEGIFLSCVQTMGAAGTNQCLQIPSFGGMRTVSGYPNMAAYSQGVYCK